MKRGKKVKAKAVRLSYVKAREWLWRKQGILEPDNSGKSLSWQTYQAVFEFQKRRCGICEKIFFVGDKRASGADHNHQTGLFRGVLCLGRRGCNFRFAGRVERMKNLKVMKGSGKEAALAYIANPPAARWVRSRK